MEEHPTEPTVLAGIDGCRAGWLVARSSGAGRSLAFSLEETFPIALLSEAAAVAVDMPIGLPDGGLRRCDQEARACLPPQARPRVFLGLRRPLLDFACYGEANAWGKASEGKGLSKQAWCLLPKVRALDGIARRQGQTGLYEVHPELVFQFLSAGTRLEGKKTAAGLAQRLALLQAAGLGETASWLDRFPRKAAQPDDLVDAAACLLAARRIHEGRAVRLPPGPPAVDSEGLRMEIWF